MFFYSPNPKHNITRRPTLGSQQLQAGQLDSRVQIVEVLTRSPPYHTGRRRSRPISDEFIDEHGTVIHRASLGALGVDEAIFIPPITTNIITGTNNNNYPGVAPPIPPHGVPSRVYYGDPTLGSPQDMFFPGSDSRRHSRVVLHPKAVVLKKPTISIHEGGRILIGTLFRQNVVIMVFKCHSIVNAFCFKIIF